MSEETLYCVGSIRCLHPVEHRWVRGVAGVNALRKEYAGRYGIAESGVWSEARKTPSGVLTRMVQERLAA